MSEIDDAPFLEEHSIVEPRGALGGKRLEFGPDGILKKTVFLVACDSCGHHPLNEFLICKSCRGKQCNDCVTKYDGRPYCRSCMMQMIPITADAFKILVCIESDVNSIGKIAELTRIGKDEVRNILIHLTTLKLVKTKGILAFTERKITADGIRTILAYGKFYDKDEDVKELKESLKEAEDGD
jgi:hypothetical protein